MAGQKITTAAELDALPVGSVVSGNPEVMGDGVAIKDHGLWFLTGFEGGEMTDTMAENYEPFTVLYRPDAEPERLVFPDEGELARVIKDAYYHARDHGGTMHTAADDAARVWLATYREHTQA